MLKTREDHQRHHHQQATAPASDFFASLKADIGPLGNLGEKALGALHLATGFWLFYLLFADILNAVLKFTLFI